MSATPHQGAAVFPTNDGLTLIAVVWPSEKFKEIRADIEGNVHKVHNVAAPSVAERLKRSKREEKWVGTAGVAELLPQALRTGLGSRRRRRLPEGPDHGAGDQRRLHRR